MCPRLALLSGNEFAPCPRLVTIRLGRPPYFLLLGLHDSFARQPGILPLPSYLRIPSASRCHPLLLLLYHGCHSGSRKRRQQFQNERRRWDDLGYNRDSKYCPLRSIFDIETYFVLTNLT